jgi:acetyltransferase-like isoleucine patch superfamily enzyme
VTLGDGTIVAANSVVRDSFPQGRAILAGSPARLVKAL